VNAFYQNIVVLTVIVGLPLLSWAVSGPRRTQYSLLYLFGTSFFAMAAAVYLFKGFLPAIWASATIRAFVYTAILLLNEFVRHAIDRERRFDLTYWSIAIIVIPISVLLDSRVGVIGVITHHSFMVFLQITVLGNLFALYRQAPSRGVISMGVAIAIVLITNISQILSAVVMGVVLQPTLQGFAGLGVYLSNILWVMLFSIGYWSYTVDVTKKAEVEAELARATESEKRRTAESFAAELAKLVRQRDESIMLNSRFETLNNVGVFNAAVIHELSQPVQKLLTKIEFLIYQSRNSDSAINKTLQEIRDDAEATSDVIHAVRALLIDSSEPVSFVAANSLISAVRPIIESQAKADDILLSIDSDDFPLNVGCLVNPVLLNRVILNLVSNALTALRDSQGKPKSGFPRLVIKVRNQVVDETEFVGIRVWDNGVGFPKEFNSALRSLAKSSSPRGMGLGLIISRQIIATWKGTLTVLRRDGGTEVSFSIPLIHRSATLVDRV
jgi:signal transduction histidine kinase